MRLTITDIQRFCMHDGPGVRTTVFLKGCPLRCEWCHNPETQDIKRQILYYESKCIGCSACGGCPAGAHKLDEKHIFNRNNCILCEECAKLCPTKALEIVGETVGVDDMIERICRDVAFYGDEGGVTLSGGEPMAQGEAVIYILSQLKKRGINTAIETCGYFDKKHLYDLVKYTDTFLWDIKDTNNERHVKYTGVSNEKIIENLMYVDKMGANTVLRCIMVNGVNATEEHLRGIAEIFGKLKNCQGVTLLGYHTYGESKYHALCGKFNANPDWIVSAEDMKRIRDTLLAYGVNIIEN